MSSLSDIAVCGRDLLQPLATASDMRLPYTQHVFIPRDLISVQVQLESASLLFNNSSIFGPTDSRWPKATESYQNYTRPHAQLVVQTGPESDIPILVRVTKNVNL